MLVNGKMVNSGSDAIIHKVVCEKEELLTASLKEASVNEIAKTV